MITEKFFAFNKTRKNFENSILFYYELRLGWFNDTSRASLDTKYNYEAQYKRGA